MTDPYTPPQQSSAAGATYQPRFWQLSGRIGRLRYLQYSGFTSIACVALINCADPAAAISSAASVVFLVLAAIALFGGNIVFGRRRLHDLDETGWTMAVGFIPAANGLLFLWLCLKPGRPEANRFGPAPAPHAFKLRPVRFGIAMLAMIVILSAVIASGLKDETIMDEAAITGHA